MTEAAPTTTRQPAVATRPAGRRDDDAITVEPVAGRRDRRRFLMLPWRIYEDDPAWVPPLLTERKTLLDRRKHPFHEHADVEYFLARRDGDIVGRIAAIVNHRHNEFHDERTGFFGFFESVDDPAVASALLATAEDWVARRGMDRIRGPMNFSTNEECGLLVDGFDRPPTVMMTHARPYYGRLIESAGYEKGKDLLAYRIDDPDPPERLVRGVERIRRRQGLTLRPMDMRNFRDEVARVQEVYNTAWERNWGFVPMTDAEFRHMAKELKPVVNPELCLIAENEEGEPVGFVLALPDFNMALKRINGRLLPFGLLKLLWHSRKIDALRVITLGLNPGYRRKGVDAMMYLEIFRRGTAEGFRTAECSWILEDNWDMRRALERMGARADKTYRIYDKPLRAAEPSAAVADTD